MDERTKALLKRVVNIVSHPAATDSSRLEAVIAAYEMGVAEGRVEGAKDLSEGLLNSLRTAPAADSSTNQPQGDSL